MTYSGPDYRQALTTLFTQDTLFSKGTSGSDAPLKSKREPLLPKSLMANPLISNTGHAMIWTMSGLVLAACGSSNSENKVAVSGKVLDGPVKNAKVYADVDGNGKLDTKTDKLIGTTDAQGRFSASLDEKYKDMALLADLTGATDINDPGDWADDAPTPPVVLRAPAGSEVISPFTEMVVRIMKDPQSTNKPVSLKKAMEMLAQDLMSQALSIS